MPEHAFDMEEFKKSLKAALEQETAVVVCVSEGIADKDGRFICEYADAASVDGFGHKMLTGCGKYLENYVKAEFGIKDVLVFIFQRDAHHFFLLLQQQILMKPKKQERQRL